MINDCSINKSLDFDKLSDLTKINLDYFEQKKLAVDISNIINFINKIKDMDTEGVEPLISTSLFFTNTSDFTNKNSSKMRPDEAENSDFQKNFLSNVPKLKGKEIVISEIL